MVVARETAAVVIARAMHQAATAYARGEWTDAERLCRQILATQGDYFDALTLLGSIATQTRRPDEAAFFLQRAVAAQPGNATAHHNYGDALRALSRFEDALDSYERALQLKPDYPDAHHNRGVILQKLSRFEDALRSFELALKLRPDFFEAYAYRGFTQQKLKRFEDALESYDHALKLKPDFAEVHNNRGNSLRELERFEDALHSYERALELRPDFAEAYNNRGVTLHELNRFEAALDSFDRALTLRPNHADAHNNRGVTLQGLNRLEEALNCFHKALDCDHRLSRAYEQLGGLLRTMSRPDQAAAVYRQWLEVDPTSPIAQHMYAATSGKNVPERCDFRCVTSLFDDFARSFEATLGRLDYAAPQLLSAALAQRVEFAQGNLDVLDAGCGTGLCGPRLRPASRLLVGVDLSSGMLARARARNVYDELVQAELGAFMESRPQGFDIVNCADTLIYVGALEQVMAAARQCLRPKGVFAFSTEALPDGLSNPFKLTVTGRYAHSSSYLREVMVSAGFSEIECRSVDIRKEASGNVRGYLFIGSVAA